jgi:hypothetical protein
MAEFPEVNKLFLYVCHAPSYAGNDLIKIGISKNPQKRLKSLRSSYDHLLEIVAIYEPKDARECETRIKRKFIDSRRKGREFFQAPLNDVLKFISTECGVNP